MNCCTLCGGYQLIKFCESCNHFLSAQYKYYDIYVEDVLTPFKICSLKGLCIEDAIEEHMKRSNRFNFEKFGGLYYCYSREVILDIKNYKPLSRQKYYEKIDKRDFYGTKQYRVFSEIK